MRNYSSPRINLLSILEASPSPKRRRSGVGAGLRPAPSAIRIPINAGADYRFRPSRTPFISPACNSNPDETR
jgi:hypothetical protein